jgi:hypothetical protein
MQRRPGASVHSASFPLVRAPRNLGFPRVSAREGVPADELLDARREADKTMDHYIPKRRVPVTLWSRDLQGLSGQIFLDLDGSGSRHQTILERLNESVRFLPVAVGDEGRIHLYNRQRITRVIPGRNVIQSDVFNRGFEPWREERADVVLDDGAQLAGRVWMPLERETQRISDFMNQRGATFFVLIALSGLHLINAAAVVSMELAESAGAPLSFEATLER